MASLTVRHIPVLLVATSTTFGGAAAIPFPAWAIRAFGLPERFEQAPMAQSCFTLASTRTSCLGILIYIFMARGQYDVIDTILALVGFYLGVVDAWICWKEKVPKMAVFRIVSSFCVGAWGLLGMTQVSLSVRSCIRCWKADTDKGMMRSQALSLECNCRLRCSSNSLEWRQALGDTLHREFLVRRVSGLDALVQYIVSLEASMDSWSLSDPSHTTFTDPRAFLDASAALRSIPPDSVPLKYADMVAT
jgi:hypothetical protein